MDIVKQYPAWFIDLMQDLCDMRDAQRSYFSQRNEHRLKIAKHRESKVDEHINRYIKAGIICHTEKNNNSQTKLFKMKYYKIGADYYAISEGNMFYHIINKPNTKGAIFGEDVSLCSHFKKEGEAITLQDFAEVCDAAGSMLENRVPNFLNLMILQGGCSNKIV